MTDRLPVKQHETPLALTPAAMLEKAITTGANVDVLEKLLGLQERWEAQQARKAFEQALADLRGDLPDIVKTKQASMGAGRPAYKYEDLSEMVDALAGPLSKHGLSFRWRTESTRPDAVTVTCILSHRDGHSEQTSLTACHDHTGAKNAVQAIGSSVTYLQRYTLKAALGIAATVDDDAQAVGRSEPLARPVPTRQPAPAPVAHSATPVDVAAQSEAREWPVVDPRPKQPASSWTIGVIEQIDVRKGAGKQGPWVKWGANILGQWYGTFVLPVGKAVEELEGQSVRIGWYADGKYRTLVSIEPRSEGAEDEDLPPLPPELDDGRLL